jgi:hypothetical protein
MKKDFFGKVVTAAIFAAAAMVFSGCEQPTHGGSSTPTLQGAVTITPEPSWVVGQTLTADVSALGVPKETAPDKYHYEWQTGTLAGDSTFTPERVEDGEKEYPINADDVGDYIRVVVSVDGYSGSVSSDPVGPVSPSTGSTYMVTIAKLTNGDVTANPTIAAAGDTITLRVKPAKRYGLVDGSLTVTKSGGVTVPVAGGGNTYTFTMPADNVTVQAVFEELLADIYSISAEPMTGGTVVINPAYAPKGITITLMVSPDAGYQYTADSLTVTESVGGETVPVAGSGSTYTFSMPGDDVTVSAKFTAIDYSVSIASGDHGSVTASPATTTVGKTVTLTVTSDTGYQLTANSLVVTKSGGGTVTPVAGSGNTYTFTMPADNVTVTATFTAINYSVSIAGMSHGSVTTSQPSAAVGTTITLTVSPAQGYKLKDGSLTVTKSVGGGTVLVTGSGNTYTFTMPADDVTVRAEFEDLPVTTYSISAGTMTGGTVGIDPTHAEANATITLTVTPYAGYQYTAGSLVATKSKGGTVPVTGSGSTYTFTMPADNVTVTATFTAINYSVIIASGMSNGSVTASPATTTVGQTVTLAVTPASGYQLTGGSLTVAKSGGGTVTVTGGGNTYTFTMPADDVTVQATFTAINYRVSIAQSTHGSVTASPTTTTVGQTVTLTVSPASGYQLTANSLTVTKAGGGTVTPVAGGGNTYTFGMPADNVTVSATFTAIDYSVTIAELTNGSVTANPASAELGQTVTLTVTPDPGYQLTEGSPTVTKAGGGTVTPVAGGGNTYTFTMPADDVTVQATFTAINYNVSIASGTHGSVTASPATTTVGQTVTLTVTPASGYQLTANSLVVTKSVGGGTVPVSGSGNTYTFTMPADNVTVTATFTAIDYRVNIAKLTNGSVTANPASADLGQTVTLTVTPASGYQLTANSLTVTKSGGVETVPVSGSGNTYTFGMPAYDVTVTAEFTAINYSVSIAGMSHGSVTANRTTTTAGQTVTLTVTPDAGYKLQDGSLTVAKDGGGTVPVSGSGNTYTFTMPADNVTVSATFTAIDYSVTIAELTNGSVTANPASAEVNQTVTLTVKPDAGYKLTEGSLKVTESGGTVTVTLTGSGNTYTFTMPAFDVTVSATFTAINYSVIIAGMSNGSVTANPASAKVGQTVTLTVSPASGYQLTANSLVVTKAGGGTVAVTGGGSTYTFTMPAFDVTVSATFTPINYSVIIAGMSNGSVTTSTASAELGQTVTLTVKPDAGYKLKDGSLVVAKTGGTVPVTGSGNIYTFTMPADNVTVQAVFETVPSYSISTGTMTGGTVGIDPTHAAAGATITLTVTSYAGYQYTAGSLTATKSGGGTVPVTGSGNTYTFTMPADNVTVLATFTPIDYSVSIAQLTNGSVTANPATTTVGQTVTLAVTPVSGYQLTANSLVVTKAGGGTVPVSGSGSEYTFTMPADNVTVTAEFTAINYSVSIAGMSNGSVTANPASAKVGQTVTLTVTPASGYQLTANSLTVTKAGGGTVAVTGSGSTYTFTMPAANVTVSATFTTVNYSVSIAQLTNGSVTASPTTTTAGQTVTLTVTPASGYQYTANSLTITKAGGGTVPVSSSGSTYTFTMPADNVTVSATFTAIDYSVSIAGMTNGSVTANPASAKVGQTVTLTVSPASGYQLTANSLVVTKAVGGGTVPVSGSGNTYTFTMPADNVTVTATFTAINYSVSIASGISNGSVTASPTITTVGQTVTLTVSPNTGYQYTANSLVVTKAGGGTVTPVTGSGNTYTFKMPADNVTVQATFTAITYSVSIAGMTNGSVTASPTSAMVGQTVTLTVTPASGYQLTANSLTVTKAGGGTVAVTGSGSTYKFTMPAANVTVTATFTAINSSVSIASGISNGSVTASPTSAMVGQTVTLTVTPASGYQYTANSLVVTKAGGGTVTPITGSGNTYTFKMPAANVTVTATFTAINYSVSIAGGISNGSVTASPTTATVGKTVTLTVSPASGYELTANSLTVTKAGGGTVTVTGSGSTYTFTMPADNVTVTAQFEISSRVTSAADSGPGTLRDVIANVPAGSTIQVMLDAGAVISLESPLEIRKNLSIEGGGVTLARDAGWTYTANDSQLITIPDGTSEVSISRVYFKNGQATDYGAGIGNRGVLTLESCIFSGNQSTNTAAWGGAIYSNNTLTIRGCTFYGNGSGNGGAVYFYGNGKTLTLLGNLFYGNTAKSGYPVVRVVNNATVTTSYNVADVAIGTGSDQSGWAPGTGDTTFQALGITGVPFNTTTFAPVSGLGKVLGSKPANFPATDFYGATRTFPGAPGAVK